MRLAGRPGRLARILLNTSPMNMHTPLESARLGRALHRVTDFARHALDVLMPEPPQTAPLAGWLAGAVLPLDDHPLEEALSAFDALFDPTAPFANQRRGRWSLSPWAADAHDTPAIGRAAATLREDDARILRLRFDDRDVALAGVHPLPAAPRLAG